MEYKAWSGEVVGPEVRDLVWKRHGINEHPYISQVEFSISDKQRPGQQVATCVRLLGRNSNSKRLLGYVATLKDNFGFIETANHDKEIFFHYR